MDSWAWLYLTVTWRSSVKFFTRGFIHVKADSSLGLCCKVSAWKFPASCDLLPTWSWHMLLLWPQHSEGSTGLHAENQELRRLLLWFTPWWSRQPRIPFCYHCKVSSRALCAWHLLSTHHPTNLGMSSKMTAKGRSCSMPLAHKLGWMFPGRANHLPTVIQVLPSYREAKLHLEHS